MPASDDASLAAARDAPTTTTTRNSNASSNSATTTTPRGATATHMTRPSASERAEAVRMRARAIAEEDRARRAAKVRAKDDKIATIAARREREGAHASSTGTTATADATRASPVKRAKTSTSAVRGGERAAWVDANGFASAEGSEEEFHDAEDEEEVGARTVRAVTRGIVERVIEDAERERGVRACVETAVASVVKANANARFERTPKKSTGEGPKKAFSFLKTPKSAGSRTKSMTTPASASASTPASTPKPKSAMEVKLSDALSAARAKAKEIEDELADSPLRSPFKQRMKAGVREHPIRRLQGAAVRLYKRTKHNVIKRVERATEKNPTAVGGGVLGFAVLVLASRRGRGP